MKKHRRDGMFENVILDKYHKQFYHYMPCKKERIDGSIGKGNRRDENGSMVVFQTKSMRCYGSDRDDYEDTKDKKRKKMKRRT